MEANQKREAWNKGKLVGQNPSVTWTVRHPDVRLKPGVLVKPIHAKHPTVNRPGFSRHFRFVLRNEVEY